MRQGPHPKRGRGRGGNRRIGAPNRNQTFDSNGPDVRIRGNASQVHEKYLALARDAASNGDRVLTESYFQHAEHYFRILNAFNDEGGHDGQRLRDVRPIGDHAENGEAAAFAGGPQPDVSPLPQSEAQAESPVRTDIAATPQPDMTLDPPAPQPDRGAARGAESPTDGEPEEPPERPRSSRRSGNGVDGDAAPLTNGSADEAASGVTVTVVAPPDDDSPATGRRRSRAAGPNTLTLGKNRTNSGD